MPLEALMPPLGSDCGSERVEPDVPGAAHVSDLSDTSDLSDVANVVDDVNVLDEAGAFEESSAH